MFGLNLPFAHINSKFTLDGKDYEVEKFSINFNQPVDHKGQPQHETKGGQIQITLVQIADDNLLLWAKKANLLKNGLVTFYTDLGISIIRVNFTDGYCITLKRGFSALTGSSTSLIISADVLNINGVEHENRWV